MGRTTSLVTSVLAGLVLVAAVLGLTVPDVYGDPAATAEMLRGWDLVAVPVAVALLLVVRRARQGSVTAHLVTAALVGGLVYTYAYYLFGTGFNDLFLLHVAVFAAALVSLIQVVADLDVRSVAAQVPGAKRARAVAVALGALALGLGGMWVSAAVVTAVDGTVPVGSRLVETETVVRLGMALDLALLVPLYLVAALLLWRDEVWGHVLAVVAVVSGLVHQASYLVSMPFQVAGGVEGAVSYDAAEPVIVLVYAVAAWLLLLGRRPGLTPGLVRSRPAARPAPGWRRSRPC
jgi:hypothetical protein